MKLHLGSGMRYIPGWVHVDAVDLPHIDVRHEVNRLPMFPNGSASVIYCCHVLEHFYRSEARQTLLEWYRILKPGGLLRIAVPDFEAITEVYSKNKNLNEVLGLLFGRQDFLYNFHYTVFDYATLSTLLSNCGYTNIRRYDWRKTEYAGIGDFANAHLPHMHLQSGRLMSLNIEAEKPMSDSNAVDRSQFLEGRRTIEAFGLKWEVRDGELIDGCMIRGHAWEPASTSLVQTVVRPGQTVMDIGANIGYYTCLMAKLVGDSGFVLAFEPMDEAYIAMSRNCALNNFTNVRLYRDGLGDKTELMECTFNYSWPENPPAVRVPPLPTRTRVWRLDDFVVEYDEIPKLDFIKIDVDGYERRVIEGAKATLLKLRPIMLVEFAYWY